MEELSSTAKVGGGSTALRRAAMIGNEEVKQYKFHVEAWLQDGSISLDHAAGKSRESRAIFVNNNGATLNCVKFYDVKALGHAVFGGREDAVRTLV